MLVLNTYDAKNEERLTQMECEMKGQSVIKLYISFLTKKIQD